MFLTNRTLECRGLTANTIDNLLEDKEAINDQNHMRYFKDDTNWKVSYDRNTAISELRDKPDGTFLIRPSASEQPYALSIV